MRSKHATISQVVRYRVLVASQLSVTDRDKALAEARILLTGEQVEAMIKVTQAITPMKSPWGCFTADTLGNVKILRYKGVDVVLYYKRPVTEIEPFPGDPIPLGMVQDPQDVWVRFELLGGSGKRVAALSTRERLMLAKQISDLKVALQAAEAERNDAEKKMRAAEAEVVPLKAELTRMRGVARLASQGVAGA